MSEKPVESIKTLARYEPDTVYIGTGEYVAECVRADDGDYYLAADVDAVIEALRAERDALRKALGRILENEASDWKFAEEFGGYILDDELREEAQAALCKRLGKEWHR